MSGSEYNEEQAIEGASLLMRHSEAKSWAPALYCLPNGVTSGGVAGLGVRERSPLNFRSRDFIHSFILAISIAPLQVLYHSEALPTTARILYRSFTPKRTGN